MRQGTSGRRSRRAALAAALVCSLASVALAVACSSGGTSGAGGAPPGDDASPAPPAPTFGGTTSGFPADASLGVQARFVLGGSCVGGPEDACHGASSQSEGLMLPDTTPSNLVDVPSVEEPALFRVKPGDPLHSYLYLKVIGDGGIDGGRMPKDRAPLDDRSIEAIAAWIDAGAPAN